MKYQVRNKAGKLDFENLWQVEQAWRIGLIAPDDEILEEGSTHWCQLSSWPLLGAKQHASQRIWAGGWLLWTLLVIICSIIALALLYSEGMFQKIVGVIVALFTAGLMLKRTMHIQAKYKRRTFWKNSRS